MSNSTDSGVRARLFCQTGPHSGQAFFLGQEAEVGSAAAAKITIKDAKMAQRQARIRYSSRLGTYVLENLSKSAPLLLDGKPVTRPRRLGDLHVLTFAGGHDYIFQVLREEVGAATSPGLFLQNVPADLLEDSKRDPSQRPEPKTSFDQVVPTPAVFAGKAEEGAQQPREAADSRGTKEARPREDLPAEQDEAGEETVEASVSEPSQPSRPAQAAVPPEEDTQAGAVLPLPSLPEEGEEAGRAEEPASADDSSVKGQPTAGGPATGGAAAGESGDAAAARPPAEEAVGGEAAKGSRETVPEAASPRRSNFLLMVSEEHGTARSYPLGEGKNLVGRLDDCQVILGHKAISRRQAALLVSPRRVVVSDLGGLNPTLVDGKPLQGEVELRPGQELRMGPFRATLIRRRKEGESAERHGSQS